MSKKGYNSSYLPQLKGLLARARKVYKEYYPDQDCCELCGAKQVSHMQVHHIDGNTKNNNPLNLMKLCITCHDDIHYSTTMQKSIIIFETPVSSFWS